MNTLNAFDKAYLSLLKQQDPFLMEGKKNKSKNKKAKSTEEKKTDEKNDGSTDKKESAIKKILIQAAKNFAKDKTGKWLNELFLGNFKDAVIDVFKKQLKSKLDNEKAIDEVLDALEKSPDYKRAAEYKKLDSRKDDNTNTDIDQDSVKIFALWYSDNKEENVGKLISELVKEIQQSGKKLEDDVEKLKAELKKQKIDVSDDDISKFGPALLQMLNDKAKPDEIKAALKKLKGDVKESMAKKLGLVDSSLLTESLKRIDEATANKLVLEAICENTTMQDAIARRLIAEGFFSDMKTKLKNKMSELGNKLKTATMTGLQTLSKSAVGPMLSLAGVGVGILTGGLGAELILKTMDIIERRGKYIRNAFERSYTKFANANGVMTKMDFTVGGDKKKKYSARFYAKDLVWRILNTADQLKHPDKDFSKAILESDIGKKYRDKLKAIWDPLFEESKGGKIDFEKLFSQAKEVKIPEKALKLFKDFAERYDDIKSSCMEKPKIDTRTQSLKKK